MRIEVSPVVFRLKRTEIDFMLTSSEILGKDLMIEEVPIGSGGYGRSAQFLAV